MSKSNKVEEALYLAQYSVDRAAFGVFWITENAKFAYVNNTACQSLGYTQKELLELTIPDIGPDFDMDKWKLHWEEIKQKRKFKIETTHKRKDGTVFPVEVTVNYQEYGGVGYNFAYASDITERKLAQEQIVTLSKFPSENPNPVMRFLSDGTIIYANKVSSVVLDTWKCKVGDRIPEPFRSRITEAFALGKVYDFEFLCDNGRMFSVTISPMIGTNYANVYGLDITDRKQDAEQLKKAKEQAEAANIAKSQFLANMSHEIRTPISVIMGFAELLASKNMNAEQGDYLEMIRDASKGLLQIINDVLDVSKVEAGKLDINIADCSLDNILTGIESLMSPMAAKRGLQFKVIRGENLPVTIRTDKDRLNQCLTNLVTNAVKFTQRGHVHLKASMDNSMLRFDVADTGIGMPPDRLETIFELFTQIDNTNIRKEGGTGLGLTITKRLAELLGGTISVSSQLDKGSVFTMIIPVGVESKSQTVIKQTLSEDAPEAESEIELAAKRFTGKVLLAEDYKPLRVHSKLLLEDLGLEVEEAPDGQIAVDMARQKPFDLILMDLRMPHLDGYQATEELKKDKPSIPIIAVTAHAMRGYKDICLRKGFDDYISKPVDNQQLVEILDRYLPPKT